MTGLSYEEQKVFDSVALHCGRIGVNPTTVAYALPTLDVYAIIQRLVNSGVLERVGGAVRVADAVPPANAEPNAGNPLPVPALPVGVHVTKSHEPRQRRKYFARLSRDPRRAALEMAARIVFQIEHYGVGGVIRFRTLRRSLHADRYPEAWKAAIRLLAQRKRGIVEGSRVMTLDPMADALLPDPCKRNSTRKPRRKRRRSVWFEQNRYKMDQGQHYAFHLDLTEE